MASQLTNELSCVKYCWGVHEQNDIVNNVRADYWSAELAIIASSVETPIEEQVLNLKKFIIKTKNILKYFHSWNTPLVTRRDK